MGEEAPVIGGGGQERPVAVKAGFRIGETALIHAEGTEDEVSGKRADRHAGASFEVPLEQDEALARVAPALPGWAEGLERLPFGAPVWKPRGVSEHVAYRDIAEDGLVQVLDELQARCAMTCFTSDAAFITATSPSTRTSCQLRTTQTDLRMPVHATPMPDHNPASLFGTHHPALRRFRSVADYW